MKINVVGTSGSGKSTLSKQLAARLQVPRIEMDRLYWRPNWQGTPDPALFASLEAALVASSAWVLDGNYNRTRSIKWRYADTVVWLDYGFTRTFCQAVGRAVWRAWHGIELWPGTGNRETFRNSFFSRESIVWWTIKTWRPNRQRYLADMLDPQYAHIRFIRLRNPREARLFLAQIGR